MEDIKVSHADYPVFHVIPSRYPKTDLYERVASFEEWELLHEIESLTNPRLRDEVGDIRLVREEDRVFGECASWIMAPPWRQDGLPPGRLLLWPATR